jgi:exosortase/archaeosortase
MWPAAIGLPHLSAEFLCRAGLVAVFVVLTHQLRWEWLRFLTSEVILRVSASLGMTAARVSFDTIRVQGQLFHVVIACTFVDVFMGSIPLLWNLKKPLLRNASWLAAVAMIFFGFNLVRLEIALLFYFRGVPWIVADQVLGGFAYFVVWLFLWRQPTWEWIILPPAPISLPQPSV